MKWDQAEHVAIDSKGHGAARYVRLRLRRHDGGIYLDRWVEAEKVGGIFLHRMTAPDPGRDLHDHPWSFVTIPLWGGYTEERAPSRQAPFLAQFAEKFPDTCSRGAIEERRPWRLRRMRLDECHRITALSRRTVLTLVFHGPTRRGWGFFLPTGWVDEHTYDKTVRVDRRDLWNEAVR